MKICLWCGIEYKDEVEKCDKCGHNIKKEDMAQSLTKETKEE